MNMTDAHIDAKAATALLNVRKETLYAYVSRGMVRAYPHPNDPRARLYSKSDINILTARKTRPRRATEAAAMALDWGLPTLETSLCRIEDQKLFYRGANAIDQSIETSFEVAAEQFLGVQNAKIFSPLSAFPSQPEFWASTLLAFADAPPLRRALGLLPLLLAEDLPAISPSHHAITQSERLVGALALALVPTLTARTSLAVSLADAWRSPLAEDAIQQALILCIDHELNASTFAVRVTASTGAGLTACLLAGLAALSGPRHGGQLARVEALHAECGSGPSATTRLRARLARGEEIPGFGHKLYPDGDPRAAAILRRLPRNADHEFVEMVFQETGLHPSIDFALVAIERHFALPSGAASTLFALGRSVGWLAHAIEQRNSGQLIRPRARFVGKGSASE